MVEIYTLLQGPQGWPQEGFPLHVSSLFSSEDLRQLVESTRVAIMLCFKGSCWLTCLEFWQRKTNEEVEVQLAATGCSSVVLQSCHLSPLSCTHVCESSRPPYCPSHSS